MASQSGKILNLMVEVIVDVNTPEEVFQIQFEDMLRKVFGETNVKVSLALFSAATADERKEFH